MMSLYNRFVNDTFAIFMKEEQVETFFNVLNDLHGLPYNLGSSVRTTVDRSWTFSFIKQMAIFCVQSTENLRSLDCKQGGIHSHPHNKRSHF